MPHKAQGLPQPQKNLLKLKGLGCPNIFNSYIQKSTFTKILNLNFLLMNRFLNNFVEKTNDKTFIVNTK